jgi:integrase
MNLIKQVPRLDNWVFAGGKLGKPLSDGAMLSLLKRMNRTDITVHGFRSTFRDWAGEETKYPTHLAELAFAHKVGSEFERAYARSDLLGKRRALMADWSAFVTN